jgi:wyosine [tRNA(Phe)-imidazoG37] synthetase (radical SAM superfamily)
MNNLKYVYGPVPSRRLGISLGISPIPKKTCNYSCIYCQLGRTDMMTNTRKMFFPVQKIMSEFDEVLKKGIFFDVITIVGEGEPTLYLGLGELISEIKRRTDKPVALITNGALFYDRDLRREAGKADIVLPTLDAYDEVSFRKINRPFGQISFESVNSGLITFSEEYEGQLWLEIMLMAGINDDEESLSKYEEALKKIKYDRLYINTPVRPPTEAEVEALSYKAMNKAAERLGGISIELLVSEGFHSEIEDDYEAILSIIKRHPMNQFEIKSFLESRKSQRIDWLMEMLGCDEKISVLNYRGINTYRLK